MNPTTSPGMPKKVVAAKRAYFMTRMAKLMAFIGMTKLEIATAATIIIIILETSPASVAVSLEGVVEEAIPYFSASDLDRGSIAAAETFKQKAEDLLKKMQKEQLDTIGLGLLYRSRHLNKDDWEQWQALYPDAKWDIKVDVTIQGTGGLH